MSDLIDRLGGIFARNDDGFDLEVTHGDADSMNIEELLTQGLSREELLDLVHRLEEAHADLIDREPRGKKSDAHREWEDQVEDLEDLIDEVYEYLD